MSVFYKGSHLKIISVILCIYLTVLSPKAVIATEAYLDPLTIAVFDFDVGIGAPPQGGVETKQVVESLIDNEVSLVLVNSDLVRQRWGESPPLNSDAIDSIAAHKIGKQSGVKILVTGRIFSAQNELIFLGKIISTETSQIYGEMVVAEKTAGIPSAVKDLGQKIVQTITTKSATLVDPTLSIKERSDHLRKFVGSSQLPSLTYMFPADGSAILVQQELASMFQGLGFTIQDYNSRLAQVKIMGTTEIGDSWQKNGRMYVQATISLQAVTLSDGRPLFSDQWTAISSGSDENMARENALKKADWKIGEKLFLRLVQEGLLTDARELPSEKEIIRAPSK